MRCDLHCPAPTRTAGRATVAGTLAAAAAGVAVGVLCLAPAALVRAAVWVVGAGGLTLCAALILTMVRRERARVPLGVRLAQIAAADRVRVTVEASPRRPVAASTRRPAIVRASTPAEIAGQAPALPQAHRRYRAGVR